jgi:hypothetical protein
VKPKSIGKSCVKVHFLIKHTLVEVEIQQMLPHSKKISEGLNITIKECDSLDITTENGCRTVGYKYN